MSTTGDIKSAPSTGTKKQKKSYASWQEEYKAKVCSAEEAAKVIRSNDRIAMSGGTCIPDAFSKALGNRAPELRNVLLSMGLALNLYDYMKPENKESFHIETVFVGPMERFCMEWGTAQYVPVHLGHTAKYSEFIKVNRVAAVVTPPDENGYMNRSCFAGFVDKKMIENAETIIVEVNKNTPWLNSEDFTIHVSEVDYIIENDISLVEIPDIPITDVEKQIAAYISDMIPNGSTIQLGFGGLANAIGYFLNEKKDLGLHTEVVSNSVMELVTSGVVNGINKNFLPNKVACSFCVGNRKFYDYIDHNTDFIFKEIGYINDPRVIGQNDGLISINNTLMMDLTGQAASESIRSKQYSGTGGQMDFIQGARYSKGGKSVIALNATYTEKDGKLRSKIVPFLPHGTIVSTSRNDVEYVVTEFGVAHLRYKSISKRIQELVNIAHPMFRDRLLFEAKKIGWI